jgi:Putative MetA-pathway of phenol degradation
MTRLRQIAMAGLAAIALGGVASSASAMETGTFQNRLNGATIGLPLGALPPPGLYTGLSTAYLGMLSGSSNSGASTGNQCAAAGNRCAVLPAIAQAVPLLWVPGWSFWGANYSASIVEAFYTFTTCGGNTFNATGPVAGSGTCGTGNPITGGGFVFTNLFVQPINLSWNLGGGWFIATAFSFTAPTGTKAGGGFTPNPDYWTLEPSVSIS